MDRSRRALLAARGSSALAMLPTRPRLSTHETPCLTAPWRATVRVQRCEDAGRFRLGSTRATQEVEEHHLRKLGPELGRAYHDLYNDYTYLRLKLKEFRELLGTPQHVDLLNTTASLFFWCVQNIWWESLLLHLCRLTDAPSERRARQTQTIQMLSSLIRCDPKLSTDVRRLATHARKTTEFARDWRNRRIAHHDGDARPLSEASLKQVEDALNAIHAVFAEIGRRLLHQDLRLDMAEPLYPPKGASELIRVIEEFLDEVRYINTLIEERCAPEGVDGMDRMEAAIGYAREFHARLGCENPDWMQIDRIVTLRETVRTFEGLARATRHR